MVTAMATQAHQARTRHASDTLDYFTCLARLCPPALLTPGVPPMGDASYHKHHIEARHYVPLLPKNRCRDPHDRVRLTHGHGHVPSIRAIHTCTCTCACDMYVMCMHMHACPPMCHPSTCHPSTRHPSTSGSRSVCTPSVGCCSLSGTQVTQRVFPSGSIWEDLIPSGGSEPKVGPNLLPFLPPSHTHRYMSHAYLTPTGVGPRELRHTADGKAATPLTPRDALGGDAPRPLVQVKWPFLPSNHQEMGIRIRFESGCSATK